MRVLAWAQWFNTFATPLTSSLAMPHAELPGDAPAPQVERASVLEPEVRTVGAPLPRVPLARGEKARHPVYL